MANLPLPAIPGGIAPAPVAPDPLAQLRDIHLPGPIDAWPPAPGWWLLALLVIGLAYYCIKHLYQRWHQNAYRRHGLKALTAIRTKYDHDPAFDYLGSYNELLKRVALSHFSREQVASLTGESWVAFLDQTGACREFSMGPGQVLVQGNYVPDITFNADELHDIGALWIKQHSKKTLSTATTTTLTDVATDTLPAKIKLVKNRFPPDRSMEPGI